MIWWVKSRRLKLLGVAVGINALLIAVLGGAVVPTIGLRLSSASIAGVAIIPILVNCTIQLIREKVDWQLERSAVRNIRLLDLELLGLLVLTIVACAAVARAAGDHLAAEGARNAVGYLGLGLVVSRLAGGRVGAVAPAFYIFLLALFATPTSAQRSVLSWPLHSGDSHQALTAALLLFIGGLTAVAAGASKPVTAE